MHARDLLIHGEAVPDQMVARMLDIKMRSPEVAHHGSYFLKKSSFSFLIFVLFFQVIFWMNFQLWMKI